MKGIYKVLEEEDRMEAKNQEKKEKKNRVKGLLVYHAKQKKDALLNG